MTPPPSPHLWTGRGQSVIIIRGCRCSIHPSLSGWGSQSLNKSNSVPRKTSATSPPFAWRSLCEAKSYEPSPPSPVHQWHYPSRCCRHRDFKEIDKEDAIRLVFLRQSAGEEEEDTAQGMTTIHGREEEWEGRGEGGLEEKLGDGGGYKEPGEMGFLGVDSNDSLRRIPSEDRYPSTLSPPFVPSSIDIPFPILLCLFLFLLLLLLLLLLLCLSLTIS